jgi:hypothetical protein
MPAFASAAMIFSPLASKIAAGRFEALGGWD